MFEESGDLRTDVVSTLIVKSSFVLNSGGGWNVRLLEREAATPASASASASANAMSITRRYHIA
jgi:hypothetical protein